MTKIDGYAIPALLCVAFTTQGAKTPLEFLIWGSAALCVCGFLLWRSSRLVSFTEYKKEFLLILCILAAQVFSVDPAASLFQTDQALILLLVWISLKSNPSLLENQNLLYACLGMLGLISALLTLSQMAHGRGPWRDSCGFFPVNPVFNATWLSCLGAAFLTRYFTRIEDNKAVGGFLPAWADLGLAILFILTVILGPMRSAAMGMAVGLVYALYRFVTPKRVILGLILLAAVLAAVPERVVYTRLRLNEENYRLRIWKVALRTFLDRPLTGWGPGNFEMGYNRHAFPVETDSIRFDRSTQFAHSDFLQVATDWGLIAFVLMVWAAFLCLTRGPPGVPPAIGQPATAGLIVLFVVGSNNITWHLPILIFLTIVWSASLFKGKWRPSKKARPNGLFFRICCIAIIFVLECSLGWCALRQHWERRGEWQNIIRWNPRDASAWKNWADQQTDPKFALEGYRQAVALVPKQVFFHEAFAMALDASRDPDYWPIAIKEYSRAIECSPSRAIDALAIGRNLYKMGRPRTALEWFQKARRIEPQYWESDLWIARCLYRLHEPRRALWTLRYLETRRNRYLKFRGSIILDISSQNLPADYDRVILAYDPRIVEKEAALYRPGLHVK